jgi:hypothetical protein
MLGIESVVPGLRDRDGVLKNGALSGRMRNILAVNGTERKTNNKT